MADQDPLSTHKTCNKCGQAKPLVDFYLDAGKPRGRCKTCFNDSISDRRSKVETYGPGLPARHAMPSSTLIDRWPNLAAFDVSDAQPVIRDRGRAERDARRASDFDALKPVDFVDEFDTSVANQHDDDKAERSRAASEKRQEFNRNMGEFAQDMRDAASTAHETHSVADGIPPRHAAYITALAEQERRFGNRRWARSIAIAEAHEQLAREQMIYIAEHYFRDKVVPIGYAQFQREKTAKRTTCLLLSDLHFGSELDSLDEPVTFKATEEARRMEFILRQVIDYKPQYREQSEALIILNGDLIEGQLMHDFRAGSPLAEQKAIFWSYMRVFIGHVAAHYPAVHVVCQSGNHGRDKVRHPGRATARKWDSHEFELYIALREMCAGLANVTWDIPFRSIAIVDLHGSVLGVTHGDTEIKLGDPDTKSVENARILDRINSIGMYKDASGVPVRFDAWCFGHYHKARYQPRDPKVLWNAALVPPNGHARTSGYIGETCGQWLWEAVEGHPIGDLRFVEVGLAQDHDERLGTLIKPFRFTEE